ncbi:MAG TPA: hypothetical protein DCS93_12525 [Microscillaceae bacterium]|nr:hypothetical protein [Microscillaceae bacterium]
MLITSFVFSALISLLPMSIFVIPNWGSILHDISQRNFGRLPPTILAFTLGLGVSSYPWFLFFPDHTQTLLIILGVALGINILFFWYVYVAKPRRVRFKLPKRKINLKQNLGVFWKNLQTLPQKVTNAYISLKTSIKNKKRMKALAKQQTRNEKAKVLWATFDEQNAEHFWKTYDRLLKQTHKRKVK